MYLNCCSKKGVLCVIHVFSKKSILVCWILWSQLNCHKVEVNMATLSLFGYILLYRDCTTSNDDYYNDYNNDVVV